MLDKSSFVVWFFSYLQQIVQKAAQMSPPMLAILKIEIVCFYIECVRACTIRGEMDGLRRKA